MDEKKQVLPFCSVVSSVELLAEKNCFEHISGDSGCRAYSIQSILYR